MINRRHLFTVEAVAATFGPASSLPVCSQFLRSNVTGSIDFRTSSCHTGPGRQIGNWQRGQPGTEAWMRIGATKFAEWMCQYYIGGQTRVLSAKIVGMRQESFHAGWESIACDGDGLHSFSIP